MRAGASGLGSLASMASFLERYHQRTKYDPRTLDRTGGPDWAARPMAWKEISGGEALDIRSHMDFLRMVAEGETGEWAPPVPGVVDLEGICRLSWFAAGVNAMSEAGEETVFYRTNPSAGGLYPVELYWWCEDVPGLEDGIWHFHSPGFSLIPVWKGRFSPEVSHALLGFPAPSGPKAMAILTGIFSRGAWRYHERAWRRMLLDAGHLAGNLLVATAREGIASTPLSAFRDSCISELLFPDEDEVPLLCVPLAASPAGWPRARRSLPQEPSGIPEEIPPDLMQRIAHSLGDILDAAPAPDHVPESVAGGDGFRLPAGDPPVGIARACVDRRSCRAYRGAPLGMGPFASLVRWSEVPLEERLSPPGLLRTWLVNLSVEGLEKGVHRWRDGGVFELVRAGDLREECRRMGLGQALCSDAAFLVVHTAPLAAAVEVLGERAYRPLCMDAGHHGQRINLAAQALGLGASGIGGYFDDLVNEVLGRDLSEAVLYVTTAGTPEEQPRDPS